MIDEDIARVIHAGAFDPDTGSEHQRHEALMKAARIRSMLLRPSREVVTIAHDGFEGIQIGAYTTLEGKEGVVLQQIGTRVVHVYGTRWLTEPVPMTLSDETHATGRTKAGNDIGGL